VNLLSRDFFTDPELMHDPAPFYRAQHEQGPIFQEAFHDVFMVSGLEEVLSIYGDHASFSAVVAPFGPFVSLPERAPGENVREMLASRASEIPLSGQLFTLDPPEHSRHRSLVGRLMTPNRLKDNEIFMSRLARELLDEFVDTGMVEICRDFALPFTLLVIADLLGVPQEDHATFRSWISNAPNSLGVDEDDQVDAQGGDRVFANLHPYFQRYVEQRRRSPGEDVLTQLAQVRFPDGELPQVEDIVRIAATLFAAGQETTARLIATGMRILAERPSLAESLRRDPTAIPRFVDECLRLESPIKGAFRLVLRETRIGGIEVPEASIVMAMNGAANRDPREFGRPEEIDLSRKRVQSHIAFGHGEHFCPGASLARAEARIAFECLLNRLDNIELAEPESLTYVNSFIIRGLERLDIEFGIRS
jgi:cytochrome P450